MAQTGQSVGGQSLQQNVQIFKTQCIGQGTFGTVHRAQLNYLPCAAKTVRHDLFNTSSSENTAVSGGETMDRIERAFERFYELRHPNVVQCLGVYRDDESGLPVLLMELAQENLSSFLLRNPLLSNRLNVQVDVSHDVALALHFLHSNGVVHGNLSGNNVLMFPSHRAKIADLRPIDLPDVQSKDGTPQPSYVPPETEVCSEETDMFSVGVVMMQLVTSHTPQPHSPGIYIIHTLYTLITSLCIYTTYICMCVRDNHKSKQI